MNASGSWQIIPLADRPEAIPIVAAWFHQEWSLFDHRSPDEIVGQLRENRQRGRIPTTFLAVRGDEIIGTISLDESDLPHWDHLTPWLASLYVAPKARRMGVAASLVAHLLTFADVQALPCIYLWTPGSTALYERFGWQVFEHTQYAGRPITIMRYSGDIPVPQMLT